MKKIVCLGTSHTFGSANGIDYPFEKTWPGAVSTYLDKKGIENYVYNGGEGAFSSYFYPTKIINFYNEYKPDMFIIELPDIDKVDVEISSAITGTYINKQKDYHTIYSRQRVLTKDWQRGKGYAWPNRKSISKGEAVDFYHGSDTTKKIHNFFHGETPQAIKDFYESTSLGDQERENVKQKFNEMYKALGRDDDSFKNMLVYCYFYSVFMDQSDSEIAVYLATQMNIINTLKMLNCKFLLFSWVSKDYLDHFIYREAYKNIISKPEYWINEDINWNFRKWVREKIQFFGPYKELIENEEYKKMQADKVHVHPWVMSMLVNEIIGPQVGLKLIQDNK